MKRRQGHESGSAINDTPEAICISILVFMSSELLSC